MIGMLGMPFMFYTSASADNGHGRDVNEILEEIYNEQDINNIDSIDCTIVSDEQFEELGDSVMGIMHPDEEEHDLMDNMMGGEGSGSLEAMHISIGRRYLGCWSNNTTYGGFGMMGDNGMMNLENYGYGGMMWDTNEGISDTGLVLIGIILFGLIVSFGIIFTLLGKKSDLSAISILNNRLAKGEIDQKTYNQLKKEISN